MKIHLTGMSPRTASERAREQMTFARALQVVLGELGHTVDREMRPTGEPDLVVIGVTSALSPGATYALAGLEAIGRAQQEGTPLLLFVDDPALDKTRSGAASARRDMTRLYSDYLMGRRIGATRNPDEVQRQQIATAIEVLAGEYWPTTLLPMHPWGSAAIASKRLGVLGGVVALDISATVGTPAQRLADPSRAPLWLTNRHYSPYTLDPTRVRWPVVPVDSSTLTDPVTVYAAARGVHQGLTARMPGWWTPTPLQVSQARTVYLCSTEESVRIGTGSPYYLTSDDVEELNDDAHAEMAEAQTAYLEEITWDLETLSSVLTDLTGRASSFATPGTSSPPSPTW